MGRLTALQVKRVTRPGDYADGGNLYLQVRSGTSKSWIFRYATNGREHHLGLGPAHTISLAEARDFALAHRKQLLLGQDPLALRREQAAAQRLKAAAGMSFRQCAERYIAAHEAGWSNAKHRDQWSATLEAYVYPVIADLPVQVIDVGLVMKVLEPIWQEKPETASRLRGRIESVLDWATARGYRQGENPARWRGHLENLLPEKTKLRRVEHHAALPWGEIGGFMAELRSRRSVGAWALEFAILTAARSKEVIGGRWSEIDLTARVWTVPAERMKGRREHRVPLSDAAMAILAELWAMRAGAYVFLGTKAGQPIGESTLLRELRRLGHGDLTVHGFRSCFRDWAAERTAYPREVVEMAMAHAVSNKVEAAYRRGDLFEKRRQLMAAWARACAEPDATGATVSSISAAV